MEEDERWHIHDPRVVALDREAGWITTACLSFGWGLLALLTWSPFGAAAMAVVLAMSWVPVTGAAAALAYRWPEYAYRHARYRLTAQRIEIERGVLWQTSIIVPRSRVQHLDVSRGPLERRHGLATLTIYTAGTLHSAVRLRGLADADAVRLRGDLVPRAPLTDGV